ncbi:MAG: hypothetical protein V3U02_00340 [Calditrichia bacterium]
MSEILIKVELDDLTKCNGCRELITAGPKLYCTLGLYNPIGFLTRLKKGELILRPQECIDSHKVFYKEAVEEVLKQFDRYTENCTGCKKRCPDCDVVIDCSEEGLICRHKLNQAADELDNS